MSAHNLGKRSYCIQCNMYYIREHESTNLCQFCESYDYYNTRGYSNFRFRAWHKKHKKMYAYAWIFPGNKVNCSDQKDGWNNEIFNSEDVTLMQSTLIKNYEGVEIFEGDKIQCIPNMAFCVYWDSRFHGFRYYTLKDKIEGNVYSLSKDNLYKCKVLGNIYEFKSDGKNERI